MRHIAYSAAQRGSWLRLQGAVDSLAGGLYLMKRLYLATGINDPLGAVLTAMAWPTMASS